MDMEVFPHVSHASDQQYIYRNQAHIWSASQKQFADNKSGHSSTVSEGPDAINDSFALHRRLVR